MAVSMSEKRQPTLAGEEVARLEMVADLACLPAVAMFTRNLGRSLGLEDKAAQELEHAVDECVTNILQHAFEPGERGEYILKFLRRPGLCGSGEGHFPGRISTAAMEQASMVTTSSGIIGR